MVENKQRGGSTGTKAQKPKSVGASTGKMVETVVIHGPRKTAAPRGVVIESGKAAGRGRVAREGHLRVTVGGKAIHRASVALPEAGAAVLGYTVTDVDDDLQFVAVGADATKTFLGIEVHPLKMHRFISTGFLPKTLELIGQRINISNKDIANILNIAPRTLDRRVKSVKPMEVEDSEKAARFAGVVMAATEVFDDVTAAAQWLKTPNETLDGKIPLELLSTESGAQVIRDLLSRIEYGIFS